MRSQKSHPASVTVALICGWALLVLMVFTNVGYVVAFLSLNRHLLGDANGTRFLTNVLSEVVFVGQLVFLLVMTHRRRMWARIVLAAFGVQIALVGIVALWGVSMTSGTMFPPLFVTLRVVLAALIAASLLRRSAQQSFETVSNRDVPSV